MYLVESLDYLSSGTSLLFFLSSQRFALDPCPTLRHIGISSLPFSVTWCSSEKRSLKNISFGSKRSLQGEQIHSTRYIHDIRLSR